jgi:hypothetical protein
MTKGSDVLNMLIPTGGWIINGNDYEGIEFIEATPITKEQYEAGFAQYDVWKAQQDTNKNAARAALLAQLGITAEQAKLLLS